MPFVKLDCGILNSTLWFERECREVFLTALLMAEPREFTEPMPQIAVHSLDLTGWRVPPGWYGFVPAAGVGILHRAQVPDDVGFIALTRLGEPELSSRSPAFEGRRMVRIDGGFVILNYMLYRERDYTTAERSKRYRARIASRRDVTPSHRDITQAEAEVQVQKKERETRPHQPRPQPIQSPRRKDAAWEGQRVYVPQRMHRDLLSLRHGAEAELMSWYAVVSNAWTDGERKDEEPGADMFAFWRARYAERWPAAAVVSRQAPARMPTYQGWECPHVEPCNNRSTCEIRTAQGRPEKGGSAT